MCLCCAVQTKSDLESCMDQWREFESWQEKCSTWLKDVEGRLRDVDLKATLPEKQTQLIFLIQAFLKKTIKHRSKSNIFH